ncbi:putative homoserine dehydrogenase-like protein [Ancylobacter aquaticus]|uniref:Putative homoserine dehydrogenase-like protein n=1 Tax=Ancylobacter aquaticus TaxID=100 RepID=A0A4R1I7Z9_ANCAQ|nr:flagellar biosynthesis protein FlgA [Ancylobacter aquaticus]TCK30261.1 putative homoserine dehydrogenase-like protein [Ancylobacter aquaticus]
MNFHRYFAVDRPPVETCVVGTGGFGRSFLAQGLRVPRMRCRVAVDRDAAVAASALASVGIDPARIHVCSTPAEALAAFAAGDFVAAGDLATVIDLPVEVVVEATGHPEAGARHARLTIEAGKHLAVVSKELDSVVGPGLARMAAARGVVATPVDGDQPSLLIGLVTWAQILGFEIVAAGKSSEYDFVFDAATDELTSNGRSIAAPGMAAHLTMGARPAAAIVAARAEVAAMLPQRAVPDLCELLIVGNATGFLPDRPDLHAPIARISEVPDLLAGLNEGGLLAGEQRIDVFHCLRAPHEPSFAGGVFVVVRCTDRETWDMLAEKGHVVSRSGATAMLYLPRHLLGVEAATTILEAALLGASSGGMDPHPHLDLVARATQHLPAGGVLAMGGHHHTIEGATAELVPAMALTPDAPAPFYLAANRTLVRPVAAGQLITMADIAVEDGSELLALRRLQDAAFFGASVPALADA